MSNSIAIASDLIKVVGIAADHGGLVVGHALAWELVQMFLSATFSGAERHRRRLEKIELIEQQTDKLNSSAIETT